MANKTNIAMVTVIGILIAAYFAIDFKQQARFPAAVYCSFKALC